MKSIAARLSEIAAGVLAATVLLTSAVTPASAQEFKIKGNIPFAFSASHSALNAGNWQIAPLQNHTSPSALKLYNAAENKAVIVGVTDRIVRPKNPNARVEFSCHADVCQMVRVFDGVNGWEVITPRLRAVEREQLLAVNFTAGSKK